MRNIKLLIEYDGTDFAGWQSQANARTVQDEITKVFRKVLQENVHLIGAGRTDAGVHARGQVANVRTASAMPAEDLLRALNALLPVDVSVRSLKEVPESFHARFDARERAYRYFITQAPSAIRRRYQWRVVYSLDPGPLQIVAGMVLGVHDFESFSKNGSNAHHYRCDVQKSVWFQEEEGMVYEIRADRFLRGMVRALVGTMVDVGRGRMTPEEFRAILEARDRRRSGVAAPAEGLFLEEVRY